MAPLQNMIIMSKGLWTFFGFILFMVGFLALILSLVGVQLAFLTWIDSPSRLFGFVVRLMMILSGAVIIVIARGRWTEEGEEELPAL